MTKFQLCQDCGEHYQPPNHQCKEFAVRYKVVDSRQHNPVPVQESTTYKARQHEDAALQWAMENINYVIGCFLERFKPRGAAPLVPCRVIVEGPDRAFYVLISGRLIFHNAVEIVICSEIEGPYYEDS